jgi:hypothetical protein
MSLGLHQSWFRMRVGLSLGKVRCKFGPLRATSEAPRRVHESRRSWRRMRAGPSFGTVRDKFNMLGATPVQPHRVRESRLSWPLDRGAALSGAAMRIRSPGACSRAATLRESEDCACRGLDACCDLFGGCRTAPKQRTHLRCCHAPCEISRRTSGYGSCLSRETGLRPDASACLGRAFLGRCGETCASFWRCL